MFTRRPYRRGRRAFEGATRSGVVGSADGRNLELQRDLLADEHAPGLQRRVPGHAEVLAVDRGPALESDAMVAERVDGGAGVVEIDRDRLGDALDGEVT